MKVYPIHLENGKTEWCVEYPNLKGCGTMSRFKTT